MCLSGRVKDTLICTYHLLRQIICHQRKIQCVIVLFFDGMVRKQKPTKNLIPITFKKIGYQTLVCNRAIFTIKELPYIVKCKENDVTESSFKK